jgi:O-antigen/teichoic acid export membrane protein
MIAGSLIGAVAAYLFQVIGGRRLGTSAFAPIAILWTVFFIVATVILVPLEQFVTREVSRGRRILVDDRRILALVILGTGIGLSAFVYATRNVLFGGQAIFAIQAGLMTILFGSMQVGKGLLAGHRKFAQYGAVLALEGIFRLTAAIVLLGISASASALAWAMVCAPLGALLLRPWRFDRETVTGVDATPAGGFLANYVVGSSASQLLLAGAPLGVVALGGNEHLRSVIFVTFTLYRAPLTLIYNLQGRILSLLVRNNGYDQVKRLVKKVATGGIALVALAGFVGWVAGPAVVEILFGTEFRPEAIVAALVAGGVIAASLTQILSQALVASGSIGELAGSWVGGLIAGIAAMTLSQGQPGFRVAVGFVVGELVAFTLACWRTLRR